MGDGYLAEIRGFAANFAPRAWAYCDGQLMAISSNTALFSLLGTIYGGDGRTTFALPDLRGRSIVHPGTGPGLSSIRLGERNGTEQVTLTINELPQHNHLAQVNVVDSDGPERRPAGRFLAGDMGATLYSGGPLASPPATLNASSVTVGNTGGQQPVYTRNPFLGINYIICTAGIFPSRN